MNHRFPNDPELKKYLRIRSYTGAVILLAVSAGITAISATSPPPNPQVSANCVDPRAPQVFSDAALDLAGCAPAAPQASRTRAAPPRETRLALPPPSADARADDPPIPTF